MTYSLSEAAKATGKSRTTIQRAIKSSKITAHKGEHGSYEIDPAELHRVYAHVTVQKQKKEQCATEGVTDVTAPFQEKIALLEQERTREREQAQATIKDLRDRLDNESEERRKLTMMLTDQRALPKGLWQRIFKP